MTMAEQKLNVQTVPIEELGSAPVKPFTANRNRSLSFFQSVVARAPLPDDLSLIVVTHILPDKVEYLEVLSRCFNIAAVIPKPNSIDGTTYDYVTQTLNLPIVHATREGLRNSQVLYEMVSRVPPDRRLVVFDIGGYFSEALSFLSAVMGNRFLGIVEDTENGHQRYEPRAGLCPVYSVARSELKTAEDHLIGVSLVYSTEAFLREAGLTVVAIECIVIGFGKVGRGIAEALRGRGARVQVYDINPVRRIQAATLGFATIGTLQTALGKANVIFCATGSGSLQSGDFPLMKDEVVIVSATSRDDEFGDLVGLERMFSSMQHDGWTEYVSRKDRRRVIMLREGAAANFAHNAVVGTYIYLVNAEIIEAARHLASGYHRAGINEVGDDVRRALAQLWLKQFGE